MLLLRATWRAQFLHDLIEAGGDLLVPFPTELMAMRPVSTRVKQARKRRRNLAQGVAA
jgi:hypothetical protein